MYEVKYEPEAAADLRALRAYDRTRVFSAIERHLRYAPTQMGGVKKQIIREDGNTIYQLRVGEIRVFYDVEDVVRIVIVRRVRHKGRKTTGEVL